MFGFAIGSLKRGASEPSSNLHANPAEVSCLSLLIKLRELSFRVCAGWGIILGDARKIRAVGAEH